MALTSLGLGLKRRRPVIKNLEMGEDQKVEPVGDLGANAISKRYALTFLRYEDQPSLLILL